MLNCCVSPLAVAMNRSSERPNRCCSIRDEAAQSAALTLPVRPRHTVAKTSLANLCEQSDNLFREQVSECAIK
jgi:hypothetical protein